MKLSIITINYNNDLELEKTINSVIQQTYQNYEFIIIDGGSTDDSVSIIKKYEQHINYWVSEPDKGIYPAMNKGIAKANGDYLLMLNSGDRLANSDVLNQIFDGKTYTEDIIYGNIKWITGDDLYIETYFPSVLTFQFFWYKSLGHQAAFIKKNIHDIVGLYDETLKFCSDWKFFVLSICKFNLTYKHVNCTISLCDCNGVSWNPKNFPLMKAEQEKVLVEIFYIFYNDYKELEAYKKNTLKNKYLDLKYNIKENIKQTIGFKKGAPK